MAQILEVIILTPVDSASKSIKTIENQWKSMKIPMVSTAFLENTSFFGIFFLRESLVDSDHPSGTVTALYN